MGGGMILGIQVTLEGSQGAHSNPADPTTIAVAVEQLGHVVVVERKVACLQFRQVAMLPVHDRFDTSAVEVELHHERLNIVRRGGSVPYTPHIASVHVIDSMEVPRYVLVYLCD